MLKEDLPLLAKRALKHILCRPGEVIYSSHETLSKGDIYLLGLNPGGRPFITIEQHIDDMLTRTKNSFVDENWKSQQCEPLQLQDVDKAPLQKRVVQLLADLGYDVRSVCASNLIFQTTPSSETLCFGLAGLCWPVHEAVLELVQPKLILTFGNGKDSPYSFIKELVEAHDVEKTCPSEHEGFICKGFHTSINGNKVFVAGLPHLSRYNPIGKVKVIEWIKKEAGISVFL